MWLDNLNHSVRTIDTQTDLKLTDLTIFDWTKCCPAPFSFEERAIEQLNNCDYSIKITMEMALSGKAPRPIRVYADGVYDMFHSGHALQLKQARTAFPDVYLIVGVTTDVQTKINKGQTVMNEKERFETIRHCRYVDEVIIDRPWIHDMKFMTDHKIDFIAHDTESYSDPANDIFKTFKENGMFLETKRTIGISTTDAISRIIKDYEVYLKRNIIRGIPRQELNISFLHEKYILFKIELDKFKRNVINMGNYIRIAAQQQDNIFSNMLKYLYTFIWPVNSLVVFDSTNVPINATVNQEYPNNDTDSLKMKNKTS